MLPCSAAQRQQIGHCATARGRYQHREPEKTLLHRIVRENLATFLVEAQERYPSGELPSFIRDEFERYLRCGLLCHGFARVRCQTCHDELLVAFSCKNRGLCPSCASRRMADFAAHLRDRVLPAVAVRQWVLTLPIQLRFLLAWRPKLIGLTLTLFLRSLFAWQRRCARRQGISKPLCGAVTCIQRFGSALNLNLHFHTLVPDGVFFEDSEGNVQFHLLPPPTVPDLEKLARRLIPRLLKKLAAESEQTEDTDWMHLLTRYLQAQSSRAAPPIDQPRGLRVFAEGFSLHAGVSVSELDGDSLERLARYCARPPLSLHRIAVDPDGQILYRAKHAAPGAPRRLHMSWAQFLGRIAALIPPPRSHLVRYHGVFAPHSRHRARIVPNPPPLPLTTPAATLAAASATTSPHTPPPSRSRLDWASLLRRVFAIDVLPCDRCGGRRQLLSMITEAKTAQKILNHLGMPAQAPLQSPARAPPPILDSADWSDPVSVAPLPSSWSN